MLIEVGANPIVRTNVPQTLMVSLDESPPYILILRSGVKPTTTYSEGQQIHTTGKTLERLNMSLTYSIDC